MLLLSYCISITMINIWYAWLSCTIKPTWQTSSRGYGICSELILIDFITHGSHVIHNTGSFVNTHMHTLMQVWPQTSKQLFHVGYFQQGVHKVHYHPLAGGCGDVGIVHSVQQWPAEWVWPYQSEPVSTYTVQYHCLLSLISVPADLTNSNCPITRHLNWQSLPGSQVCVNALLINRYRCICRWRKAYSSWIVYQWSV